MTEDEMVGCHHGLNRHEFEQTLRDSEGQEVWCAAVCWVSDTTEQLNKKNFNNVNLFLKLISVNLIKSLSKNPRGFVCVCVCEIQQLILKVVCKYKGLRIAKTVMEKNQMGGFLFLRDIVVCHKGRKKIS